MYASKFKSYHHIYILGHGKSSRILIKNIRISFTNYMLKGMYYNAIKVNMKKFSNKDDKVVD